MFSSVKGVQNPSYLMGFCGHSRNQSTKGYGGNAVGKVFARQAWRHEFNPQSLHEQNWACCHRLVMLSWGRQTGGSLEPAGCPT